MLVGETLQCYSLPLVVQTMVVASSAGAVAPCSSSLRMRARTVLDAVPRDTKRKHCFAISIVKGCTSGLQPPLTIFAFCVLFEGWAKSKILPHFPRPLIPRPNGYQNSRAVSVAYSSVVLAVYTPLLCRREPPQFNGGFKRKSGFRHEKRFAFSCVCAPRVRALAPRFARAFNKLTNVKLF